MYYLIILVILFQSFTSAAQNKMARVSLNYGGNVYYTSNTGKANDNIRVGFISGASGILIDTVKHRGLVMDMLVLRSTSLYRDIIGSNKILKVRDVHINYSFIYPIFIKRDGKIEQILGLGIGVSMLGARIYYDETGKLLDYNSSTLPKLKDGKYWGGIGQVYYQLAYRVSKRLYLEFGSHLYTSTRTRASGSRYEINQGTGITLNGGVSYRILGQRKERFSQYKDL